MTKKLGYPALAKEIQKEFEGGMKVEIPASLRLTGGRDFSVLIARPPIIPTGDGCCCQTFRHNRETLESTLEKYL